MQTNVWLKLPASYFSLHWSTVQGTGGAQIDVGYRHKKNYLVNLNKDNIHTSWFLLADSGSGEIGGKCSYYCIHWQVK